MRILFFLFVFLLFGCQNIKNWIVEKDKSFYKPVSSEVPVNPSLNPQDLNQIKERLDLLERNTASKFDMDSSIENLRKELNEFKKQVQDLSKSELDSKSDQKEKVPLNVFAQAEEHFKNKKWKQAIFIYEEFRKKNKKSEQFKVATLKIGLSFQNLDLQQEAQVFFQEVVDWFPQSAEAQKARELLKNN